MRLSEFKARCWQYHVTPIPDELFPGVYFITPRDGIVWTGGYLRPADGGDWLYLALTDEAVAESWERLQAIKSLSATSAVDEPLVRAAFHAKDFERVAELLCIPKAP